MSDAVRMAPRPPRSEQERQAEQRREIEVEVARNLHQRIGEQAAQIGREIETLRVSLYGLHALLAAALHIPGVLSGTRIEPEKLAEQIGGLAKIARFLDPTKTDTDPAR